MNYIQPIDLGPSAFSFSHRSESRNLHWHMLHAHQGLELLYVHEGDGSVTVERRTYKLQQGMLFCFQPYQLHSVDVPLQGEALYIRTNVTFDPRIADRVSAPFPMLQSFVRKLWKGALSQQVFALAGDERLPQLLDSFEEAQRQAHGEAQEEERGLFLLALLRHLQLHVFPAGETGAAAPGKASRHIERIQDWVEAHYVHPYKLEHMAADLHLSPFHISHLFKRLTGVTLSDCITSRRLREACALLANTDKRVGDIAREVGGFSTPYFCQLFKKHKGVTPQSYRATVRRSYER